MIKKGYKVVTCKLESAVIIDGRSVIYKAGESVAPNRDCGPLTVFKSVAAAVHFEREMPDSLRIFKCFYISSTSRSVWDKYNSLSLEKLLERNLDCILPDSVDLADEVILAEEL